MNKKEDILRTTIELYQIKGDSISLDDISSKIGCSKTLILYYFNNRSALLSACFCQICRELKLALDQVIAPEEISKSSMRMYLTELWRAYFNYLKDNPSKAKFFIQYSHRYEPPPPGYIAPEAAIKKILDERYDKIVEGDEELLFEIKYMIAIANGMAALVFSQTTDVPEDVTEKCIELIMNGLSMDDL